MRRVIFTLLYDRGQFMLSRNFRLQAVGGIDWLFNNYDFARVSHGLDELMVLDVCRGPRDICAFCKVVRHISGLCFIPMTVGGGISSVEIAHQYLRSGADKLLINSSFDQSVDVCQQIATRFGRQSVIAGTDYKMTTSGMRVVVVRHGTQQLMIPLHEWVDRLESNGAGELLFQSIDRDGTGMGLDLSVMKEIGAQRELPLILMGGVGKPEHIIAGLNHPSIDAVATANRFNFIGTAFLDLRGVLSQSGLKIAKWCHPGFIGLNNKFSMNQ